MAKYDYFDVSEKLTIGDNEGTATIRVLFEDGDEIVPTMMAAQTLIDDHVATSEMTGGGTPSIDGAVAYLQSLSQNDAREANTQYWISVMNTLGQGKYAYANELRQDVNTAQNGSN